jgi:hypothetical protein
MLGSWLILVALCLQCKYHYLFFIVKIKPKHKASTWDFFTKFINVSAQNTILSVISMSSPVESDL